METNGLKKRDSEEIESWLQKAARAPEEPKRAVLQLNPLPGTAPKEHSSLADTVSLGPSGGQERLPIEELKERYEIEREFARGGLGRILRAKDKKLGRTVALKELLHLNEKMMERFLREVKLTARLEHPSIVPIYDISVRPDGEPYYSMRLIDGKSLDKVISEKKTFVGRLSLLPHLIDACKAIAYAHSRRVIHRDLKPHNILIGEFGEAIVIDWGLAKELGEGRGAESEREDNPQEGLHPNTSAFRLSPSASELTSAGSILGTPAYMPPEQAKGEPVDERADVYALGAILYHVLAGHPPYYHLKAKDTLRQVHEGPPRPLQESAPETPRDLVSIVQKAMSRDRNERYKDAGEMLEELLRFQAGKLVGAHSYTSKEIFSRWLQKNKIALTAGALVVLAGIVSFGVSYYNISAANKEAQRNEKIANEEKQSALFAKAKESKAKLEAQEALTSLLLEQGIRELGPHGDATKAARYLTEAYLKTPDAQASATLRYHMRSAVQSLPLFVKEPVAGAGFSSDGARLYLLGKDGTGQVIDVKTSRVLSSFGAPLSDLSMVAIASKGARAAVATQTGQISVWDIEKGALLSTFAKKGLTALGISPDGETLFTYHEDQRWRLWDTSGKLRYELPLVPDASLVFSRDGARFLYRGAGARDSVFETNSGRLLFSFPTSDKESFAVLSPDGERLARVDLLSTIDGPVSLWDINQGALLGEAPPRDASGVFQGMRFSKRVFFSPDGTMLAHSHPDNSLTLSRIGESGLSEGILIANQGDGPPVYEGFSEDGQYLFTLRTDGALCIWDTETGSLLKKTMLSTEPWGSEGSLLAGVSSNGGALSLFFEGRLLVFDTGLPAGVSLGNGSGFLDPSGRKILSFSGRDFVLWDSQRGKRALRLEELSEEPTIELLSPNGAHIITVGKDGAASVWDANTGARLLLLEERIGANQGVWNVKFSPDGTKLFTNASPESAKLWDLKTGALLASLEGYPERPTAIFFVFSPDSTLLAGYSTVNRGPVQIWDTSSGKLLHSLESHRKTSSIAFSPDSRYLSVTGSVAPERQSPPPKEACVTKLWDLRAGKLLRTLEGSDLPDMFTTFSPDGARVISSGRDQTAKVWSIKTGELLFSLRGHKGPVSRAIFSPDGTLIATTGHDGTAKLWDASTGELISTFSHLFPDGRPAKIYTAIQFSPDGAWLLTEGEDQVLRQWSTALEGRSKEEVEEYVKARLFWKNETPTKRAQ